MYRKYKSVLNVNIAVLLFGLTGILGKRIGIPALGITFGRVFFSSIALFLVLKIRKHPLKLRTKRDGLSFLGAGFILAVHWWSFLEAVRISTVAVGTVTFSVFPLFVAFLEPCIQKRKPQSRQVWMAVLLLVSVLITVEDFSFASRQFRGVLMGLLSAFTYAVLTIANKQFSRDYSGTLIAFYEQAFAAILLLPLALAAKMTPTVLDIGLLAVLGVITTAIAHTLFINSLKGISAHLAGICSSMETVYGILFAFLFLGERPAFRVILGAVLILGIVTYSQIKDMEEKR